jgi:hypothetical protein
VAGNAADAIKMVFRLIEVRLVQARDVTRHASCGVLGGTSVKPEDQQFRRCDLRIVSFAVHYSFHVRFARTVTRFTPRSVLCGCRSGFRMHGLVELIALSDMAIETYLLAHKILGVASRWLPHDREILVSARLALRDGDTYRG